MNRPRLIRGLRIAWSVWWAALCVLLVVFWVRSYWWSGGGFVKLAPAFHIQVHAIDARMCVWFECKPVGRWFDWWSNEITFPTPPDIDNRMPWFDLAFWPTFARLYLAHLVPTTITGALAALPWIPTRFSIRGLLIATTVIAAIIGLIIWVDRTF